jgi:hypothetical protein
MYAPFTFFYLLTTLVIYRRYVDHTSVSRVWPIVLALLTVITHQLGFSLAIVFLIPLIVRRQTPADRNWIWASSVATGAFYVAWDTTIERFMRIHMPPTEAAEAVSTLPPVLAPFAKVIGQLAVPPHAFVADLLGSGSLPLLAAALALFAATAGGVAFLHRHERPRVLVVALACVLACALQQINVAVLVLLLYLLVAQRGVEPLTSRGGLALVATIGIWFAAWLAYAYYFTEPNEVAAAGISTHVRQSIRTLLDYPLYNVMWGLFFEMPLASIVAVLGMLWCVDGAARRGPEVQRAFLLYVFVLPLVVSGIVATTFRELRYVMHFDVFFLTFVALGVAHWRDVFAALKLLPSLPVRGAVNASRLGTAAAAVLAFVYVPGPVAAWVNVDREHGQAHGVETLFKLSAYPDYRSPSEYIRANRDAAREPLIALQPREFYTYLRDVDYWLTTHAFETENHAYPRDGRRLDIYIDVPIISTMQEVRAVIDGSPGPVWLLASDALVASRTTLTEDLAEFIEGLDEHVVYTGLDGDMRVYRLERHRY